MNDSFPPQAVQDRFDAEFANPNKFDSSSQFHPKHRGRLYTNFLKFLEQERKIWRKEMIEYMDSMKVNPNKAINEIDRIYIKFKKDHDGPKASRKKSITAHRMLGWNAAITKIIKRFP